MLAAAVLVASPASAGQYLAPGPGGFRYAPPRYYGPPPGSYPERLRPALQAKSGPVYRRRSSHDAAAGAGSAARSCAIARYHGRNRGGESQGVTRQEVGGAIADFCNRNTTASLCVKLQSR